MVLVIVVRWVLFGSIGGGMETGGVAVVEGLTSKLSSQEIILAALVLLVSAGLFIVSLRFTYKILLRRDEVIECLSKEIGKIALCVNKVVEVQNLDHDAVVVNRDILQSVKESLSKVELCLGLLTGKVNTIDREIQEYMRNSVRGSSR